jgi:hypothetical protein
MTTIGTSIGDAVTMITTGTTTEGTGTTTIVIATTHMEFTAPTIRSGIADTASIPMAILTVIARTATGARLTSIAATMAMATGVSRPDIIAIDTAMAGDDAAFVNGQKAF